MSDLVFSVKGESLSSAKFKAKVRDFELIVDEPEALGGTDQSPNPVEYILTGFAGCLNVVGFIVAKELDFEIDKLKIEISGNINPNKFLGLSSEERAGYKNIEVKLVPETKASIETLVKWLHIVQERCPVKDNLINDTLVNVSIEKQYAG